MDVLLFSRVQFAVTTYSHFLFVPLTPRLSIIVAIMETIYVKEGNDGYLKMTGFRGKILTINFAVLYQAWDLPAFQKPTEGERFASRIIPIREGITLLY
jgi:cytochrome d ubiquinol oxidase subunit I